MVTTLDDFSNFFIPLIILGSWCLFEGGHMSMKMKVKVSKNIAEIVILCKRCRECPLPHRLAGLILFSTDIKVSYMLSFYFKIIFLFFMDQSCSCNSFCC